MARLLHDQRLSAAVWLDRFPLSYGLIFNCKHPSGFVLRPQWRWYANLESFSCGQATSSVAVDEQPRP